MTSSARPSTESDPYGPQASICKPLASRHRPHRRPHRRHRRCLPCRHQMSASIPPRAGPPESPSAILSRSVPHRPQARIGPHLAVPQWPRRSSRMVPCRPSGWTSLPRLPAEKHLSAPSSAGRQRSEVGRCHSDPHRPRNPPPSSMPSLQLDLRLLDPSSIHGYLIRRNTCRLVLRGHIRPGL